MHRLLHGGWRAEPGVVWARSHGLDPDTVPAPREPDLFDLGPAPTSSTSPSTPPGTCGRSGWPASGRRRRGAGRAGPHWRSTSPPANATRSTRWLPLRAQALATARAESTAEVLCVELGAVGLPVDVGVAEAIIAGIVGPRPRSAAEAEAQRAERDAAVLRHAPPGRTDLRNPAQVRSLLRRVGVEVSDTRAWRLEQVRDAHPLVDALLAWRRIERTATTYGYGWLDEHVRGGRLRGEWTGSDGAAGRMTATAGLHSLPADLRPAVVAEPGHVFVRADLGQIEPRVLAAVSGDRALARGDEDRRHVRTGRRPAGRRPGDGEGRRARGDVRPDDRARRPGPAPPRGRVPGGHGVPARRRRGRPGRAQPAHVRRPPRSASARRTPTR